jgi:hypothetical protein
MASYYENAGLATGMDATLPAIRNRLALTNDASKLIIVMVGMPARSNPRTLCPNNGGGRGPWIASLLLLLLSCV